MTSRPFVPTNRAVGAALDVRLLPDARRPCRGRRRRRGSRLTPRQSGRSHRGHSPYETADRHREQKSTSSRQAHSATLRAWRRPADAASLRNQSSDLAAGVSGPSALADAQRQSAEPRAPGLQTETGRLQRYAGSRYSPSSAAEQVADLAERDVLLHRVEDRRHHVLLVVLERGLAPRRARARPRPCRAARGTPSRARSGRCSASCSILSVGMLSPSSASRTC